jgi:MFS superfamily sulfate permease-like transporter
MAKNQPNLSFKNSWRTDLVAGFSVSLVALPLSLGLSIAAGAPPMAGVIAAMVGGIITTFIRSGHISINGPSPALIGIVFAAIQTLGGWEHVLGTIVIAGVIQFVFGLLKMGKLGDFFPSSVVQGMMAAIGVIILASQVHVGLGVGMSAETPIQSLAIIPKSLLELNPYIAIIFFNSLVILAWHPYVKSKFLKFIPAPMWILLLSIPMFQLFQTMSDDGVSLLGSIHPISSEYLVNLPENIWDGFSLRPNFEKIGTGGFWVVVFSIFLISTIETLLSAKAIDKIDQHKRKTNLNRDLSAMGISTVISGFLGGFPVISVIARSSVNINHGATTRYSNLFHGIFIVAFVFLFASIIQMVPLAALAAILVFTGYKLASPKVFSDASLKGYEQLMILLVTLIATLMADLIKGIAIGIVFTLLVHLIRSHLSFSLFIKYISKPVFKLSKIDNHYHLKVKGIANFINVLKLRKLLSTVPDEEEVIFDLGHTRLVDYTLLEFITGWGKEYEMEKNGSFAVVGLDEHLTTSDHPFSIHALPQLNKKRMSKRQLELFELSQHNKWTFEPKIDWLIGRLRKNKFFDTRPIEYAKNRINGSYSNGLQWEINDITFDEGALMAAEVHHATMLKIQFDKEIPDFQLEGERFFQRLLDFAIREDINFEDEASFNTKFSLRGDDRDQIKELFTSDLKFFLKNHEDYHVESQNNTILIFRYFRILSCREVNQMIKYGQELTNSLTLAVGGKVNVP